MKIKIKEILVRGEQRIFIESVEGLGYEDLPDLYTEEKNSIQVENGEILIVTYETKNPYCRTLLRVGEHYSLDYFNKANCEIENAVKLLKKIEKKLHYINYNWGKAMIYIY